MHRDSIAFRHGGEVTPAHRHGPDSVIATGESARRGRFARKVSVLPAVTTVDPPYRTSRRSTRSATGRADRSGPEAGVGWTAHLRQPEALDDHTDHGSPFVR